MNVVSVTRLRLRSPRFLPLFFWHTIRSFRQAKTSPGNLGVRVRKTQGLTFWTLTRWKSEQAMKAFRDGLPHRLAMRKLAVWCDEASFAHWTQDSAELPPWDLAVERLQANGKLGRVLHPSADQKTGRIVTT
jgi:heme-degrading monooxygenase HmoA